MYTFLSGMTPFYGPSDEKIYRSIREDELEFNSAFDDVSPQAKDLLRRMLEKKPNERICVKEALQHEWFGYVATRSSTSSLATSPLSHERMRAVDPIYLKNLLNFTYMSKMHEILYKYFVNQITTKKEREVGLQENL